MNPSDERLYVYSVWSLATFLLASAGALLILMLANVIGPFRFSVLDPSQAREAIGFWLPLDGKRPFPPEIALRTEAWRRFVTRDDVVIESARLRDLLNAGVGAVIIPDARVLSEEQAEALDRYMMDGGGIVLSGSIGVRDAAGGWLGYGVMREVLRATSIVPLPREQSQVVAANRRGPISARLGPAQHFRVVEEPGVPALEGSDGELVWALAADGPGAHAVAAQRVRLGRGRLAWVGPGPEVVFGPDEQDRVALDRALENALAWVRRRPVLELVAWPGDAPFAVEIAKPESPETVPRSAVERQALEARLGRAIDEAARSGEFVLAQIPVSGPGDPWAEALRLRLLERVRGLGGWLTTQDQAADWAAMRSGIRFSVTRSGPSRLLVNVTNQWTDDLTGLALRLWINRPAASIEVAAVNVGQSLPEVRFDRASESADLSLPRMAPTSTLAFTIDLDDPDYDPTEAVRSD